MPASKIAQYEYSTKNDESNDKMSRRKQSFTSTGFSKSGLSPYPFTPTISQN